MVFTTRSEVNNETAAIVTNYDKMFKCLTIAAKSSSIVIVRRAEIIELLMLLMAWLCCTINHGINKVTQLVNQRGAV